MEDEAEAEIPGITFIVTIHMIHGKTIQMPLTFKDEKDALTGARTALAHGCIESANGVATLWAPSQIKKVTVEYGAIAQTKPIIHGLKQ